MDLDEGFAVAHDARHRLAILLDVLRGAAERLAQRGAHQSDKVVVERERRHADEALPHPDAAARDGQ